MCHSTNDPICVITLRDLSHNKSLLTKTFYVYEPSFLIRMLYKDLYQLL